MSTGLLSADEVSAFYDPKRQELTLGAKGTVQPITENIHFVRLPFVGGLLYELIGTTYGVQGEKQPYEKSETVPASITPFPRDVIIKTSEHPTGKPVPIYWGGFGLGGSTNDAALSSAEGKGPVKELPAPNEEKITAIVGESFAIKQDAHVPKHGSVNIDFDRTYLELSNAGINDTQISWTFVGKKAGPTQINVLVAGGIADFVIRITYNVTLITLPAESN